MRTMLISLVFTLSLSQLAAAGGRIDAKEFATKYECGTTYKCYTYTTCKDDSPTPKTLQQSAVEEVKAGETINDDCGALIRFYSHSKYKAIVIIESLLPTTNSIELIRKDANDVMKSKFSCKLDSSGKLTGSYAGLKNVNAHIADSSKLKCEFLVTVEKNEQLLDPAGYCSFKIDSAQTDATQNCPIFENVRCDSKRLKYISGYDKKEVHARIKYTLVDYHCENPKIFTMSYRKDSKSQYEARDVKCIDDTFKLIDSAGKIHNTNMADDLDIKCIAEAKYFCQNKVKEHTGTAGETLLEQTISDWSVANPQPSSLKCPPGKPYLMIFDNKKHRPILDKSLKFECLNHGGGVPVWTIGNITLLKSGPAVYCTAEINCKIIKKIPENAVKKGKLVNGLPECFPEGTMFVDNKKHVKTRCDMKTGQYMYTVENDETKQEEEHKFEDNTKFVCKYEKSREIMKQNQDNDKKVMTGSIAAAAIAATIIAIVFGVIAYIGSYRYKKKLQREQAAEKAAWNRYCFDSKEKQEFKKLHNIPSSQELSASAPGETWKWNAALMSVQHDGLSLTGFQDIAAAQLTKESDPDNFLEQNSVNEDKVEATTQAYNKNTTTAEWQPWYDDCTEYAKIFKENKWETRRKTARNERDKPNSKKT